MARAFNLIYNLNLSTMGEMNIAYWGELRTSSRCGRLDQACAFGVHPVQMTFNAEEVEVKNFNIRETLYWVFSDLNGQKDTIKILTDLNKAFPFADGERERNVQYEGCEYDEEGEFCVGNTGNGSPIEADEFACAERQRHQCREKEYPFHKSDYGIAADQGLENAEVDSEKLEPNTAESMLKDCAGILVAGGFGLRGVSGMMEAAKYARTTNTPYLGICLGMQIALIEFARSVLGI